MTHVWTVWESDPESAHIVGLFLSEEGARSAAVDHADRENARYTEMNAEDEDMQFPLWKAVAEGDVMYRIHDEGYTIEVSQMEVQP